MDKETKAIYEQRIQAVNERIYETQEVLNNYVKERQELIEDYSYLISLEPIKIIVKKEDLTSSSMKELLRFD